MSVATDKRDTSWVLYRMLHEKRAYGVALAVNVSEIEQVGAWTRVIPDEKAASLMLILYVLKRAL